MAVKNYKSEVRDSIIRELLDKVRKNNYSTYLLSMRLERIRLFEGVTIKFDFPVTALIGPNGSGKSTILSACSCVYSSVLPQNVFKKSRIGDESMDNWKIIYELVEKDVNPKGTVISEVNFEKNQWSKKNDCSRNVKMFGINRTVPAVDSPLFNFRQRLSIHGHSHPNSDIIFETREITDTDSIKREAERILGKYLSNFKLIEITFIYHKKDVQKKQTVKRQVLDDGSVMTITKKIEPVERLRVVYSQKQTMYVSFNGQNSFSEFNFGSGEASIIRMVAEIEAQPNGSLILIDEIENGLHPLAVLRLVEYLIDVSNRKNHQVVFTTHSDYALVPLPIEAVWAAIDGKLQQGKLSVEALRAISGLIDTRLAVFVEDDFAKAWIETIIREKLGERFDEVGIYAASGDGNAVKIHKNHNIDPSSLCISLCFLDGDSKQKEDKEGKIFRLPGSSPESTVFNSVVSNIENNIAILTVACQRSLDKQDVVRKVIMDVSHTNRDPHNLFNQIGERLGLVSGIVVRGAFFMTWIHENPDEAGKIAEPIRKALDAI